MLISLIALGFLSVGQEELMHVEDGVAELEYNASACEFGGVAAPQFRVLSVSEGGQKLMGANLVNLNPDGPVISAFRKLRVHGSWVQEGGVLKITVKSWEAMIGNKVPVTQKP